MPRTSESSGILRRGSACLSCRRRKLRCDGVRPVCQQCNAMRRVHECVYDDSSRKSRTQTLREKVSALEAKVRELESSNPSPDPSDPSSSSSAPPVSTGAGPSNAFSYDDPFQNQPGLAMNPLNSVSWLSDDLDSLIPLVPQEWISTNPNYDLQTDSGSGSSSSNSQKASVLLDVSLPHYSAHPSSVSPIPFTDSSGTPVPDLFDRSAPDPHTMNLTIEMHNMLVQTFIEHRKQCCFYSNTSRFDRSSSATVYQNTPPNPALMSAIYLMGSFFVQNLGLQKQLCEQTQQEVARSLHNQDQLMDVVQASYLLAQYFFFNGRGMEGTRHLTTAKRIAFDLGLHQVSLPTFSFDFDYSFDSSSHDWQEKTAVLWGLFMVEKFWALNCDCWEAYAQADFDAPCRYITTPLPVQEGADLELVAANSPLNAMFDSDVFRGTLLSVDAFKALACCIFDRALRFHNTPASSKDSATWAYHRSSEIALERLSSLIHPLTWRDSHDTGKPTIDTDLYIAHALIHASTIHLHPDSTMNLKISWAAKKLVELVNHLSENDYCYLDPILAICWSSTVKIFRQMIQTATDSMNSTAASASTTMYTVAFLRHCVNILVGGVQSMSMFVPLADNLLPDLIDNQIILQSDSTKLVSLTSAVDYPASQGLLVA